MDLGTSITQPSQDPQTQCGPQLTKLGDNDLFRYLHTHVHALEQELLEGKACVLIAILFPSNYLAHSRYEVNVCGRKEGGREEEREGGK